MNDTRTFEQKYQAWIDAVNACWAVGWTHSYGWVFEDTSGVKHDLSAADLDQLQRIEREGLFIANANGDSSPETTKEIKP